MKEFSEMYDDMLYFDNAKDKYYFIIEYGNFASSICEFEKSDDYLVHGCTSSLWLKYQGHELVCQADSAIVRGIAGMICDWYNQASEKQRNELSVNMLKDFGLMPLLSMGRQNGVANLVGKVKQMRKDKVQ